MVGNEKENMENSRVLVVGLGRSGIAAAEALKRLKADVSVYDSKFSEEKASWAEKNGFPFSFGERPDPVRGFDMLVLSPGVPTDPALKLQENWNWHIVSGEENISPSPERMERRRRRLSLERSSAMREKRQK